MSDFGDDEFPNMICVEAGNVTSPVILLPGGVFEASQILQVFASIYFIISQNFTKLLTHSLIAREVSI